MVDYWNNIDSQVSLDMDVLDDFIGEAKEIHRYCTELFCTALYYSVLYCIVLYCTVLYHNSTWLYFTSVQFTLPHLYKKLLSLCRSRFHLRKYEFCRIKVKRRNCNLRHSDSSHSPFSFCRRQRCRYICYHSDRYFWYRHRDQSCHHCSDTCCCSCDHHYCYCKHKSRSFPSSIQMPSPSHTRRREASGACPVSTSRTCLMRG